MPASAITHYRGFRDQAEPLLQSAITRAPLAVCKIWIDGTLVSVVEGAEHVGFGVANKLAYHYQDAFSESPEAIRCIEQAFRGEPVSTTLRLSGMTWDARFFPASDPSRTGSHGMGGVMAILTDASSRLAAFRLLRTLDIVATVGRCLGRAESEDDFLNHTCRLIHETYPAWIGVVDRAAADRSIRIIAAEGHLHDLFASQELSWDATRKRGQTIAGEAIRTGQVQVVNNLLTSADCAVWHAAARDQGWTSALAIPLVNDGASLGVLVLFGTGEIDEQELPMWEHIGKEITEGIILLRERANQRELALARKEVDDKYRRLIETAFDIIIQHQNGKIVEINTAGMKHAGARDSHELIGAPFVSLVAPEDRGRVLDAFQQAAHADIGTRRPLEFKLLGLNGTITHVEGVTVPTQFNSQPAFLSVLRDISVRKLQERALSEAKGSLDYAQKIAKLGSIELDVGTGTAVWSVNAYHLLNVDPNKQENDFLKMLSTGLSNRQVDQIRELVTRIRVKATAESDEMTLPSGERRKTVHIDGIPVLDDRANVSKVVLVIQDVTDLRNIEQGLRWTTERLRIAQEIGRTGDFEIHVPTKQLQLSHGARNIVGLPNRDEQVALEKFYKCLLPSGDQGLPELIEKMLAEETPEFSVDAMLSHQPNRWVNVEASLFTAPDDSKIIGNIRDITDRKLIEKRLSESEARLKRAQLVARVWEFEWDVLRDRVTWSDNISQVLGMKMPVDYMTFEQFLSTMVEEDRPIFRQAAMDTRKLSVPGEAEYNMALYGDMRIKVVSRWEPAVFDDQGKVTKIRGISQDVTSLRDAQERMAYKHRFHQASSLPNVSVLYDRIACLLDAASTTKRSFSLVVLKLDGYKLAHSLVVKDVFYGAIKKAVRETRAAIGGLDTITRLEKGRFAFLVHCDEQAVPKVEDEIRNIWGSAFEGLNAHVNVLASTANVRCPDESNALDGIVKLGMQRLDPPGNHESQ